ncbi:MAG: hypothetical protein ABL858_07015 [Candidatus Nitrotoga sp.]
MYCAHDPPVVEQTSQNWNIVLDAPPGHEPDADVPVVVPIPTPPVLDVPNVGEMPLPTAGVVIHSVSSGIRKT